MTYPTLIAWGLAGAGSACAILAAYQGGTVAALGAASGAFLSAAGVVGWTGRAATPVSPAAPVKQ